MLDPNFFILARAIHEERIRDALQRQRHDASGGKGLRLQARVLASIGDRLIVFGLKLKAQAASV